jgi:hypothetical protein
MCTSVVLVLTLRIEKCTTHTHLVGKNGIDGVSFAFTFENSRQDIYPHEFTLAYLATKACMFTYVLLLLQAMKVKLAK